MTKQLKIFIIAGVVIVAGVIVAAVLTDGGGADYPVIESERPFLGRADASVIVQEFSDFQCPACQSAESTVKKIVQDYGDRIRFEYKHFPLTRIHPKAFSAALASECAHDQGKFWEYHDLLFLNQPNFSNPDLESYASQLGLDAASFSACLKSRAKADIVNSNMDEAESLGLTGTPTFFVNGKKLNSWGLLEQEVKAVLGE